MEAKQPAQQYRFVSPSSLLNGQFCIQNPLPSPLLCLPSLELLPRPSPFGRQLSLNICQSIVEKMAEISVPLFLAKPCKQISTLSDGMPSKSPSHPRSVGWGHYSQRQTLR
mmetsp:Transcript_7019/g.11073  ORF Transcript_7019/g.11073 Transcript_7019/m.11073 type:complete len:111 (+) Transcript_7019:327-659(+)